MMSLDIIFSAFSIYISKIKSTYFTKELPIMLFFKFFLGIINYLMVTLAIFMYFESLLSFLYFF